jgi:DNA polymerase-4
MLDFTPVIERASIDEMYMDFTGCEALYGNNLPGFMKTLQQHVWNEFSLPCTIALGSNKYIAKIGAGTVKPAGICIVPHGEEKKFLAQFPIDVIPGVGPKTAPLLREKGLHVVADIQHMSPEQMSALFGEAGIHLLSIANGEGPDTLTVAWERKSISREETFDHDIGDFGKLAKILHSLSEDVCSTLRSNQWRAKTVALKLRYADFKTLTRAVTIEPTDDDTVVLGSVTGLLRAAYSGKKPVRLLGVRLSNFSGREEGDLDLFPENGRRSQMFDAVDKLRRKFGNDVIHVGGG